MASTSAGAIAVLLALDTSKFSMGLETAKKNLNTFADQSQTANARLASLGEGMTKVGGIMTKTLTTSLVALGTASVTTFTSFDDSMRQVIATMSATSEETERLTEAAKYYGSTTRFSASEAASALNYLALAGYTADEAIGALPTVLNMAAAGAMDLGTASDMLTDAMSALGKDYTYMSTMADQITRASQKSNTSISQLGEAILTIGGTAKGLAGGTVELATALGLLADNGIKGAEGGTHLRNIMLSLQKESGTLAKKLKVDVYDAEGNMRGLEEIFSDLNVAMADMTSQERDELLTSLFNKTDLAAINALLDTTTDRWNELTAAISGSEGAAEEYAETMEGGIGGSVRNLKSAVEGLAIEFGDNLAPSVQGVADWITNITRGFSELDEGTQTTIVQIGAVVAAIGPALMIGGKVISMFSTLLPLIQGVAAIASGPVGWAAGAAAIAAGLYQIERSAENLDLDDKVDAILKMGDATVEGDLTAKIRTKVELYGPDGETGIMDEIEAQLPNIYDAMAETLTDGKPDTPEVLEEQKKEIQDYYANAVSKVNQWAAAEISKLDTNSATFESDKLAIETSAAEMVTTLQGLEAETIAWMDENAGKSTATVKAHMDELNAIEAKALQVMALIDAVTNANTKPEVTEETNTKRDLIANGVITDKNAILDNATEYGAVGVARLTIAQNEHTGNVSSVADMLDRGYITPDMAEEMAAESMYNLNTAQAEIDAQVVDDTQVHFAALTSELDYIAQEAAEDYSYSDMLAAWSAKFLADAGNQGLQEDLYNELEKNGFAEKFAKDLGIDPAYLKEYLNGEYVSTGELGGNMQTWADWYNNSADYVLKKTDFTGTGAIELFNSLVNNGLLTNLTSEETLRTLVGAGEYQIDYQDDSQVNITITMGNVNMRSDGDVSNLARDLAEKIKQRNTGKGRKFG